MRAAVLRGIESIVEDGFPALEIAGPPGTVRHDADKTFEWLDRAWTERDPGLQYLLQDQFVLRFRDDKRFAAFCEQVGLPTGTDAKAMP